MLKINNYLVVNIFLTTTLLIFLASGIIAFLFKGFCIYIFLILSLINLYLISKRNYFEYEFDGNFIVIRKFSVLKYWKRKSVKPSLTMPCTYLVHYFVIRDHLTQVVVLKFKTSSRDIKVHFHLCGLAKNQKLGIYRSLEELQKANCNFISEKD
ncbi:hypothetical protein EG344_01840 [Chryseobacterium sp. G0162]|nr:hypothetical protein EG344_01840 [Chryseobacterium sp. G0162]